MSGDSVELRRPAANDRALILREQLELYVEAAVALRDIVKMKPILDPFDVYGRAARVEQYDELIRRATTILEQLGLGAKT